MRLIPQTTLLPPHTATLTSTCSRPHVRGKFLYLGSHKLYLRGVTYGTFRSDADGNEYHDPVTVERDFAQMFGMGINAVRTYTVPPCWLLDAAQMHGLYVMVGLPWEQHISFLDDPGRAQKIEERVRAGVRACAQHPALLCYVVGNEIPSSIVRWHGHGRIERFIERLYSAAKEEDPGGLVTYVNYPTTEYLHLPFLDFVSFNVYLEDREKLEAYLARLQNLAGERPLVMAELGLDSRRNGLMAQAQALDWQVRAAFGAGCAGAFVFAWTDEWHRGGHDVEDWDFGLTDRERRPKPALQAISEAFAELPFPSDQPYPRISVVVCSYNGSTTIGECLRGLDELEYPNYEVILVNDGSTDATAAIASEYNCLIISTENRGLSSARNTGLAAATGEIVAYIDDDAWPDPHWLHYLASSFSDTEHAAMGGPNIAPFTDAPAAHCVGNAPGNPTHVLLSDQEAEHIPGCNMAFRKAALQAIGGFDPQFRIAGDDVDVCWRLRNMGWTLGFSPAAVVWHHPRSTVRAYWQQQVGYGRAEALLERKWPEKYNAAGHMTWAGRLYGSAPTQNFGGNNGRIYGGVWGSAPFQSLYGPPQGGWRALTLMPEWYLVLATLATFSLLGFLWTPLLLALPLLVLASSALVTQAVIGARKARFAMMPQRSLTHRKLRLLTTILYLLQPLARMVGRMRGGLTPWRVRGKWRLVLPRPRQLTVWSEQWQAPEKRLQAIEATLKEKGAAVLRGGGYDRWDLEVRGGMLCSVRLLMAVEEHGAGKQMARFRLYPRCLPSALASILLLLALSGGAALAHAWIAAAFLAIMALFVVLEALRELSGATASAVYAVDSLKGKQAQDSNELRVTHYILRNVEIGDAGE